MKCSISSFKYRWGWSQKIQLLFPWTHHASVIKLSTLQASPLTLSTALMFYIEAGVGARCPCIMADVQVRVPTRSGASAQDPAGIRMYIHQRWSLDWARKGYPESKGGKGWIAGWGVGRRGLVKKRRIFYKEARYLRELKGKKYNQISGGSGVEDWKVVSDQGNTWCASSFPSLFPPPLHIHSSLVFFFFLISFIYVFSPLAELLGMQNLSSPTRDWTCAPGSGNAKSKLLDHQGSPSPYSLTLLIAMFLLSFYRAAFFTLHGICVDLPDLANENIRCL